MISNQLIYPKSITVIGGSNDPLSPGGSALKNLIISNFKGQIYVVNPLEESVQGFMAYKSVIDTPDTDLAILATDDGDCINTIKTLCTKKECKAIISYLSSLPQGAEAALCQLKEQFGLTIMGPNSAGVLTPSYSALYTDTLQGVEEGIDIISSSRTTISFMIEAAKKYGLQIANIFSVGYSCCACVEDILEWIDSNLKTEENSKGKAHKVIAIYIEKITNSGKMLKHCRSLRKKGAAIVAIKGGCSSSEIAAGVSHTGVLVSSTKTISALFEKCGIIRAFGREELMNIAAILYKARPLQNRVAILTQAGGPAVMLSDILAQNGVEVKTIFFEDFNFGKTAGQISALIDKYDKAPDIDAIIVIFGCRSMSDTSEVYHVMYRKIKDTVKPVYPLFPASYSYEQYIEEFHKTGGITFTDEVIFGKALSDVINAPKIIENTSSPAIDKEIIRRIIADSPEGWMPPFMVQQLLDAAGIERLKMQIVDSPEKAAEAAISIGYPVVLKIIGPVHRVEFDGVSLNITDEHTLRSEYQRMSNIEGVRGFIVQPMLEAGGVELFIGAKRDKNFDPLIMCGLGGIFVEAIKDLSFGMAPLSCDEADKMIRSLKGYPIIKGYRGKEGVNEFMFNEIIRRVSALCMAAPEIVEVDLNPLFGDEKGVMVISSKVRINKTVCG